MVAPGLSDRAVLNALGESSAILALVRVGSSTRPYIANVQDLDYLAVTSRTLNSDEVLDLLSDVKPHLEWSPATTEQASWRIQLDGLEGGIVFVEHEAISRELRLVTSGTKIAPSYSQWTLCGNAPEVLCADIVDGVVLLDQADFDSEIRASLLPYPDGMRLAIAQFCLEEIGFKRRALEGAIRNSAILTSRLALTTALLPILRARCAMDGVYFRGLKNLDSFLRHHLSSREKEIHAMLTLGSVDEESSGAEVLSAIQADLAYWLNRHNGLDARTLGS